MAFEVTFNEGDSKTVERYMKDMRMDISEVARQAIMEMIFNDDADLTAYNKAIAEYEKNPVSYPIEKVWKDLNL